VVLSDIAVSPHRCRDKPTDSPSIVRILRLNCGVDTVPAARQVSFAPAWVRIRQWPVREASGARQRTEWSAG
jgi:hypothetical protein